MSAVAAHPIPQENTPVHEPIVVVYENAEQWHKIRLTTIGASEVATLFNKVATHEEIAQEGDDDLVYADEEGESASPYSSHLALHCLKSGLITSAKRSNNRENWGNILEPVIAARICDGRSWKYRRPAGYYLHPTVRGMGCTLDFEVDDDGNGSWVPMDIKNVAADQIWKWRDQLGNWVIPEHIYLQMQHQLSVTGKPRAYVGVLFGGNQDRIFPVERDDELIEVINQTIEGFWYYVDQKTRPEIDPVRDDWVIGRLLARLETTEPVDWSGDRELLATIALYQQKGAAKTAIEKEAKELSNTIKARLIAAGATAATLDGGRTLVATLIPEAAVSYVKEGYRRLHVKNPPKKDAAKPRSKAA